MHDDIVKVLLLLDSLAPGGTETSTVLIASGLTAFAIEPVIITLRSADHRLAEVAASHGVRVEPLPGSTLPQQVRALRKLLAVECPQVLHTALYRSDQVGRLAAIRTGIPVVSSFVSTPYVDERFGDPQIDRWKLRVAQVIDAATARFLVDSFHAVSEGARMDNASALKIPLDRIHVVERGRDPGSFDPCGHDRRAAERESLGVGPSTALIANIGRHDYAKAQADLIRASSVLGQRAIDHVIVVAGKDGNASADIARAMAATSNALANVQLVGHVDNVSGLLCAADVVVVSSLFEGTAGAALEAMAMGVPVVATDIAGTRGILVHEENALLVPIRNPAAMAEAIERILSDPALAQRLVSNGLRTFATRFTLDHSTRGMAAMYRQIAARR